jgi:hypothetical protein
VSVKLIQEKEVSEELDGRDDIAPALPHLPIWKRFRLLGSRRANEPGRGLGLVNGSALLCKPCIGYRESECQDPGEECPQELAEVEIREFALSRSLADPHLPGREYSTNWISSIN